MPRVAWIGGLALSCLGAALAASPRLPTTRTNFFHPGTQPGGVNGLLPPQACVFCHGNFNPESAPYNRWVGSMMAQSARDPVFKAALAIAEQDAAFVAESCLRCHAPTAFAQGHVQFVTDAASPSFGSSLALAGDDLQGVSCSLCHRAVDPTFTPGKSPPEDQAIITALPAGAPEENGLHNGAYVLDTQDRRRGPYNLDADWQAAGLGGFPGFHAYLKSPFHQDSRMCAACHDVSTAHFTRQGDGTYLLNASGAAPAPDKHDQFPEQRTYSEWLNSLFAQGPVNLNGRFGGTRPAVSSCQDCHMPGVSGQGCGLNPPLRPQLGQHDFAGANSWVVRAVRALFPDSQTGLSSQTADDAIARGASLLDRAADLTLTYKSKRVNARITNYSGHKLPTGYTEGRRMWINVRFLDAGGGVVQELGGYDATTATLDEGTTRVYAAELGLDEAVATLTGNQPGPAFHLALSNKVYLDNRIPPMGFTNAKFEAAGAGHVPPGQYADGQYWDDVGFDRPNGAVRAEVSVYHQTSSREYMEFLRDTNTSTAAGQTAYDQWTMQGKSAPVLMDSKTILLVCACDWDVSGSVTVQDLFAFLASYFQGTADFNGDGRSDRFDVFDFLACWFAGCAGER